MKKLANLTNPFILLLVPVFFAVIMGISYQMHQLREDNEGASAIHTTSLFYKGVGIVKTVCAIAREKNW